MYCSYHLQFCYHTHIQPQTRPSVACVTPDNVTACLLQCYVWPIVTTTQFQLSSSYSATSNDLTTHKSKKPV